MRQLAASLKFHRIVGCLATNRLAETGATSTIAAICHRPGRWLRPMSSALPIAGADKRLGLDRKGCAVGRQGPAVAPQGAALIGGLRPHRRGRPFLLVRAMCPRRARAALEALRPRPGHCLCGPRLGRPEPPMRLADRLLGLSFSVSKNSGLSRCPKTAGIVTIAIGKCEEWHGARPRRNCHAIGFSSVSQSGQMHAFAVTGP